MNPKRLFRRRSTEHIKHIQRAPSSGDELENDAVPNSDAVLDHNLPPEYFKQDVINVIHELRIPGWSLVTTDMSQDLDITRISGALSNAVYALKAPYNVKEQVKKEHKDRNYTHRTPHDLLLRVYGPQVEFLIDRKQELETLGELNKHNIGPHLLGTFSNGRFEQFLKAQVLTKEDIRDPETSKQIARRMRDLHDRVPVCPYERADGFKIMLNIDRWGPTVRSKLIEMEKKDPGITKNLLKVDTFDAFMEYVAKYRQYLNSKYSYDDMVFCHNDTQYGNIMKLDPPKGSPLLQPQNEHCKLVVIDFEYSGPNLRGYDIANHFCEWMGDYHHPTMSYHIFREAYPTPEQQLNFIQSYVEHSPHFLDEKDTQKEQDRLFEEIKDWLPSVSIGWAFWGVIQTPIVDSTVLTDKFVENDPRYEIVTDDKPEEESESDDESDFDNFAYSKDKISLFWDHFRDLNLA